MTTPSTIVFLHRNDGVPVVAGAGVRVRVLLRPGLHTLEHVLDDATARLGLHTAATGLCRPDGTRIAGLDDLTPKCDLVVLEGRKGFIAPGADPKRSTTKSPGRSTSSSRAKSPGRATGERPASLPRQRHRTPTRSAGLQATVSSLSTASTHRASVPAQLAGGSQSISADSLGSIVDKPLRADESRQGELESETADARGAEGAASQESAQTETGRAASQPATRPADPTEHPASQKSPARSRVVRVSRHNPAREVALRRRGQRSSSKTKLGAQLLENRRKHAATKQANLKRELAATREGLITGCDNGSESSDVSAVETRSWGSLAETWTPPPLERVRSIDNSTTVTFGLTDAKSIEEASAPSEPADSHIRLKSNLTQEPGQELEPEPEPEAEPEPEPEQEPGPELVTVSQSASLQDSQPSAAVLGDTYADLYVQVRAIYNTAHSTLQRQLATPASANDPLLVRMAELVVSLDALAADVGSMPAGATVGSVVQVPQFSESSTDRDIGSGPFGSDAVVDSSNTLAAIDPVQPQQRRREPPALPSVASAAADNSKAPTWVEETPVSERADIEKENAAAVSIQARIRGRQDRRRAAVQKLIALRETRDDMVASRDCCLDLPIDKWLAAQNESTLTGKLQEEFGVQSLWELVAVIQDPLDWTVVLDEPNPARSDTLWKAMQRLIAQASDETAGWHALQPSKSHEQVPSRAAPTSDGSRNSNSVRVHVDDNGDSTGPVLSFTATKSVDNVGSTRRLPPPLPQTYSSTDEGKGDADSLFEMSSSPGRSPTSNDSGPFTPTSFRA